MLDQLKIDAEVRLEDLRSNPYPGRGIVLGLDESSQNFIQIYWIMGRKPNSRNRIFVQDNNGTVRTAFADPSRGGDPSLVIYVAMAEEEDLYVVSNGNQTDTVTAYDRTMLSFHDALLVREYEPDDPNFTSRITGIVTLRDDKYVAAISVLRRSPADQSCDRLLYEYGSLCPGFGYCVTTYAGDGDPLPAFRGEPYPLPISGADAHEIADEFWDYLNAENRVALVVKTIHQKSGETSIAIINKHS